MDMPGIRYHGNGAFEGDKDRAGDNDDSGFYNTRGRSTFSGPKPMPIIIDGQRTEGSQMLDALEMMASDIEEVEVLQAWQALAYTHGAIDGAIVVKTRGFEPQERVKSKGALYTPLGLSGDGMLKQGAMVVAPNRKGRYRLLVDVASENGIRSIERSIAIE